MLPVKSVAELYPAYRAFTHSSLRRSSPASFSAPTSPKTFELRARYEALHVMDSSLKSLKSGG